MKELAEMLPVGLFDFNPEPAYNIAPTQKVAVVRIPFRQLVLLIRIAPR
jgi:putative SOS response-associated peptidase YedK